MIFIQKLRWDQWNIAHIARHNVIPEEVEEICHRDPLVQKGKKGRKLVIGSTSTNKIITNKKRRCKEMKKLKSRIPEFKSREEEARWFDTHDMADYQNEFKTIKAKFAKNLSEGITIRLDPTTLTKLRSKAHKKGVGPTTLARMWILENLQSA